MTEPAHDLETALAQARLIQEELDRKVLYLKALFETSCELSGLIQPKKILDTFLLMAMGPLGITHGLAALVNVTTGQGQVSGRGFSGTELDDLARNLALVSARHFPPPGAGDTSPEQIRFFSRETAADYGLFPLEIRTLIFWKLANDYAGFVGFGERISGQPLDESDRDLLLNLTSVLTSAIARALSVLNIEQLNAGLQKKNTELEAAFEEVKRSQDALDRQVIHLRSLAELNAELSPLTDMGTLLQTFVMTVMGSLGVGQGFVLFFDRTSRRAQVAGRGLGTEPKLDGEGWEKLLYRCLESLENKSLAPMSVSRIADPTFLGPLGIAMDPALGFFFILDPSSMGLVLLGPRLSGEAFLREEMELLATQTASLLVFLENARAFETICALNEDLTTRNEELHETISELTEAKRTITLLEKTRARIRSAIQNELERLSHANPLDFVLILVLAACIGVLFNFSNPQGVPLVQESALRPASTSVDALEAGRLIDEEKAVLVDARPKELFDQQHIRGALNIPLALFDIMHMMKLGSLDPETPIIVYGRTISRLYDEEMAYRLKQRDHDRVVVLAGGLDAWKAYGYPVQ